MKRMMTAMIAMNLLFGASAVFAEGELPKDNKGFCTKVVQQGDPKHVSYCDANSGEGKKYKTKADCLKSPDSLEAVRKAGVQ